MKAAAAPVLLLALLSAPAAAQPVPATASPAGPAAPAASPADPGRLEDLAARLGRHRAAVREAAQGTDSADPTRLSPRFEQALRAAAPERRGAAEGAGQVKLPAIALAGMASGGGGPPSALLRVDTTTYLVRSGSELTLTTPDGQGAVLRVEAVGEAEVRVRIGGRQLVLR
jgi:ferric-dicitrate binding protein FerR (iron transport regulator)